MANVGKSLEGYAADFIVLAPAMDLAATYLDAVCRFQDLNIFLKRGFQMILSRHHESIHVDVPIRPHELKFRCC